MEKKESKQNTSITPNMRREHRCPMSRRGGGTRGEIASFELIARLRREGAPYEASFAYNLIQHPLLISFRRLVGILTDWCRKVDREKVWVL